MHVKNHDSVHQVKEQIATLAQEIIEQAATKAMFGADMARGAASQAKEHVPKVGRRKKEEVVPTVREVAFQAAAAALDLWQAARDRAEGVVDAAGHRVAEPAADVVGRASRGAGSAAAHLAGAADTASDRAKSAASSVVERAEDASDRAKHAATNVAVRAEDVSGKAKGAAALAVDRAEDATGRAKEATKHAAGATVSTSKETLGTLFWTAAAAGIIFYALLNEQRREQILKALDSVFSQAREMIREIQGYDDEFV
jgi:hypothetical protein